MSKKNRKPNHSVAAAEAEAAALAAQAEKSPEGAAEAAVEGNDQGTVVKNNLGHPIVLSNGVEVPANGQIRCELPVGFKGHYLMKTLIDAGHLELIS